MVPKRGQVWGGRYRLETPLDGGQQAETWLARSGRSRVVLKMSVRSSRRPLPSGSVRCRREVEILRAVRHRNVVRARDRFEAHGRVVSVFDPVPGRPLIARMRREPLPVPLEPLRRAVRQLAAALSACHARGVVHRDLKPGNVMVEGSLRSRRPRFVLIDFGVARRLDVGPAQATTIGRMIGTPRYAAPEQLAGKPAGPAADQFALGCLIYELATGRRPFLRDGRGEALPFGARPGPGNDRLAVARRILSQALIPPSRYRPALAPLDDWFRRALDPDPARRHRGARAMALAFDRAHRPPAPVPGPLIAAAVALSVLLGVVTAGRALGPATAGELGPNAIAR